MGSGSLQPIEARSKRPKSFLRLMATQLESLPNIPRKSCPAVASVLELPDPTVVHCRISWIPMWSATGPVHMTTYSPDRMVVLLLVEQDLRSSAIKRHGTISLTMTSWLNRRETISMASCKNPFADGRIPELSPKGYGREVCGFPFFAFSQRFPFSPVGFLYPLGRGIDATNFPLCAAMISFATILFPKSPA